MTKSYIVAFKFTDIKQAVRFAEEAAANGWESEVTSVEPWGNSTLVSQHDAHSVRVPPESDMVDQMLRNADLR